ncbi:Ppx/GppA phosphatase family protein [Clostridium uliginosum]|uniref:Exopolyphosphatase / guanosine-5'-triphosphate,3'-diphosphate pyrophosphatase n=1 Tax=Clostridium uliginosum TaxID=119641 RepID=A0A1I1K7M9_9CLOT|nr:Ppx/GppA phosphatase family protein [Clostridium uliginosum]SFC56987.1 exopolyphosphatase / guanosine-5'-triphosphate,3'-diphosphate pyrophosphatase [Clostridium uliginosum]
MNKIGVIYIGANSVKFTLMNVLKNGYYKVIGESSSDIKLSKDLVEGNELSQYKIEETLANVRSFKSLCTFSDVKEIIAVANCSLKRASNCNDFLEKIKDQFNINVTVLSNEEEIHYTYLGVTKSIYTTNSLILDVCGASTHLTWVKDGKIKESATIPFGSLNYTFQYHLDDRICYENLDKSILNIKSALSDIEWLEKEKYESIIAVGGTARAICKIDRAKKRYPFDILHNYKLNDIDVHKIYNLLKCKDFKQRTRIEGLSLERADLIVGGLTIFDTIIEKVKCEDIIISGRGLREGIMFEYIEEHYTPINDILDYNLNGIIDYLNINRIHAEHVFNITSILFNELKPLHKLGDKYNNVLKTATLLHDSGVSIDYYHHHKHSFYVILNSSINGLSHKELLMSAAIAATHNEKDKVALPPFFSIINKFDIKAIDSINILLMIAEHLDKSLERAVDSLNVDITEESVLITISSHLNINLEINQVLKMKDRFKNIYGKNLEVKQI